MDKLNFELRTQAIGLGLCEKWQNEWTSDKNQQELIDMWKKGIDFGIAYHYPSNEFIKTNFDRKLLRRNLVFIDEDINLADAPSGVYIVNGDCSGSICLAPWSVSTIYLRHGSRITIEAGDFSRVFIRLYDNSDAEVSAKETAITKVYDRRK